ncbi:hypothetical protein QVD17_38601 [Tagetes erecta]|uniref:Uncharacterized protein n=1 Tax=Tagetes erecta TaxID=13708 RepID=A0AAD8JQS7_TARER|nr:hypothetical protein QVD17_38601 [Tagetes erecta]
MFVTSYNTGAHIPNNNNSFHYHHHHHHYLSPHFLTISLFSSSSSSSPQQQHTKPDELHHNLILRTISCTIRSSMDLKSVFVRDL